jgi:tetratricopeptide (TPR) repeat protein
MKAKLLIFALLIFSPFAAKAQWAILSTEADSLLLLGREKIYNCEFEAAEEYFEKVKELEPDHPAGYFLDAMVYYWKLTLYRFTDYYHKPFLDRINKTIKVCDARLDKMDGDIVALFFKGGALGYRGRFYGENEQWIRSARDGLDAYNMLIECLKIAPSNKDILSGLGIFNFYAEAIPDKYPMTKPLLTFLPGGDKKLGLLQLHESAQFARYTGVEAEVALLQAYHSFQRNNVKANEVANDLHTRYPENPYFHRYLGRTMIRLGQFNKMETLWRDILLLHIDKKPGYDNKTAREAIFNIGWALQKRGENEMAIKYFNKSIEASKILDKEDGKVSGFRIEAELKLAISYYNLKQYEKSKKKYQDVLKLREYAKSHTRAKNGIKKCEKKQ